MERLDLILEGIEKTNEQIRQMQEDNIEHKKETKELNKKIEVVIESIAEVREDIAGIVNNIDKEYMSVV